MVLPAYVYRTDARETAAHFSAVIAATRLPCMLYNNPPAYGTDVAPEELAALASKHPNLVAVKESSEDVRRVAAIRALLGDRMAIFVGVDDLIVEGVAAGAVGWVAGLVNALPAESVRLFDLAAAGRMPRGPRALRVVPAPPAPRRRAEVRAAHQARAAGDRDGLGARAPAASEARREGTRRGARP